MTITGLVKWSSVAALAAVIMMPVAVSAQSVSIDGLRAQKGPEEKIAKLQQKLDELKAELKIVRENLVPFDTFFAEELDSSSKDGDYMYAGTGLPATTFVLQKDEYEVGLKFHYRQGDDIPASYIDTQGVVHVFVPSGPQVVDPAHGVPVAHPTRAAWNVAFSVNTGLDSSDTLADANAKLRFDLDPNSGTDFLNLDLVQINASPGAGDSGYGWSDGQTNVINDDGGTSQVTQNSFNYEFIRTRITGGYDNYPPATFDIQLIVKGKALIKARVHVIATAS